MELVQRKPCPEEIRDRIVRMTYGSLLFPLKIIKTYYPY